MLESRRSYGYGGSRSGVNSKDTLKKYQVCYRSIYGSFGEIGYKLFDTKDEALEWGEKFKQETGYVSEIIVRHPSAIYSNY